MPHAMEQCHRPWWKRPPFLFLVIAAVMVLLIVDIPERGGKSAPTPYSAFLDQLEAGNVASVTFQGTEIHGRYRHPLDAAPTLPAHGMMGLVSGLFAKRDEAESPPAHDGDEPKSR